MTEVVRNHTVRTLGHGQIEVTWSGLDADDSGNAVNLCEYTDFTVQVTGTFNGGTCTLYGSNDRAAVLADRLAGTLFGSKTAEWIAAQDSLGNNFAKTAAGGDTIVDSYEYYLPVVTGGGGSTNLKVILKASKRK